jgi:hypothetical protein
VFRVVRLANLFRQKYGDEGFYSGEEVDLMDEENLEPTGTEEGKAEEIRREEPETLETGQTVEASTIILLVDSIVLSNQSNPIHQSFQRNFTSSPPHT